MRYGPATEALKAALDLPAGAAQVVEVVEGSPADEAGIEAGDVIVAVDGRTLRNHLELSALISAERPGERIALTLDREGDRRQVSVRLGEAEEASAGEAAESEESATRSGIEEELGLTVETLTPEIARRMGLEDRDLAGVVIDAVDNSSDAFRSADLRPGQIIVEVGGQKISDVRAFERAYRSVEAGKTFLIRVLQQDGRSTLITALRKPAS